MMNKASARWWERFDRLDTALSLGGRVGKVIVVVWAALTTGVTILWSHVSQLSPPAIFALGLMTAASTALLVAALMYISSVTGSKKHPAAATLGPDPPLQEEPAAGRESSVEVVATALGFDGNVRRRPGEIFWVRETQAKASWYIPLNRRLSDTERLDIQRVAVAWTFGAEAAQSLVSLFDHAVPSDPTPYWLELLRSQRDDVYLLASAIDEALSDEKQLPLVAVHHRLNTFLRSYHLLAAWLAIVNERGDLPLTRQPIRKVLDRWMRLNVAFREHLINDLSRWPAHRGLIDVTLHYLPYHSKSLFCFLTSAGVQRFFACESPGTMKATFDDG